MLSRYFQTTFSAFQYRNYRLWFFGQVLSLMGTWMQGTAQGYLVYELTHSPAFLGYVSFANGLPSWLFLLYAGVVADRFPRRRIMVGVQCLMMLLALALAALTFLGIVRPWHILVLSFLLGVANAFEAPARLAFVRELVDRDNMTNAIALNATMFNTASAVGPAIGGLVYAAVGPAWCFTINGISFLPIIASLLLMRIPPVIRRATQASAVDQVREGLRFTFKSPIILLLMLVVGCYTLFGLSFGTLLPAWAVSVLNGDVRTNGLLRSAQGVGSLISALVIASLSHRRFRGRMLTIGMFGVPLFMFLVSLIRTESLALLAMVGVGMSFILIFNLANALVQSNVDDALRGRVMSIYSLTFFGIMPLGSLLVGFIADHFGEVPTAMTMCTILAVFAAVIFLFVPRIRRLE